MPRTGKIALDTWEPDQFGHTLRLVHGGESLAFGVGVPPTRDGSERSARQMFAFSLFYLFLIFTALLADRLGGGLA